MAASTRALAGMSSRCSSVRRRATQASVRSARGRCEAQGEQQRGVDAQFGGRRGKRRRVVELRQQQVDPFFDLAVIEFEVMRREDRADGEDAAHRLVVAEARVRRFEARTRLQCCERRQGNAMPQRHPRRGILHLRRQDIEPTLQGRDAPLLQQHRRETQRDLRRGRPILRGRRDVEGGFHLLGLREQRDRIAPHGGERFGRHRVFEPFEQEGAEQIMELVRIAAPFDEQALAIQRIQQMARGGIARDHRRLRRGRARQQRDAHQLQLHRRRQRIEDLAGEIAEQHLASLRLREARIRMPALHLFEREHQADRPAVGLRVHRAQRRFVEVLPQRRDAAGFVEGQAQIIPVEQRDAIHRAQRRAFRRRFAAAGRDDDDTLGRLARDRFQQRHAAARRPEARDSCRTPARPAA